MPTITNIDSKELESKVKAMYRDVAENPHGDFHFEMGRKLAERLGYSPTDLDRGSGSGMDTFIAALKVGPRGKIIGIDMTDEQRRKAERLRDSAGLKNVTFLKAYIEEVPCPDASVDVVISNGVINLSPDKPKVFREAARLLKSGGRLAISDIVTEKQLPEGISCNVTLWAACIGGAAQQDNYRADVEAAGFKVVKVEDNSAYQFISENAQGASKKFGVKSISLLAVKP